MTTTDRQEKAIATTLRVSSLLPFVTGAADMIGGTWILQAAGVSLSAEAASDPLLNSQIKFWGAIWFGYGAVLWWVAGDLRGRAQTLRLLVATMALAGLGRALAFAIYGSPGALFNGMMVLELVWASVIWLWHRRWMRG